MAEFDPNGRTVSRASPSLALVKYWGKADTAENLPATPSIGITLDGLYSTTEVTCCGSEDAVSVDGSPAPVNRYRSFFDRLRSAVGRQVYFQVRSSNNFPTAAGLASSSSGFAALSLACSAAAGVSLTKRELSALARFGSASAARAVYGGFVSLDAGAEYAEPVFPEDHWPELRIIVVAVASGEKAVSSRKAMELSRTTSPYYERWVTDSVSLYDEALAALRMRDMERLGHVMGLSYMRMFAAMLSCDPPVHYWLPDSTRLIHLCGRMRSEGIGAWETMDAGPQVKIACLASEEPVIRKRLAAEDSSWTVTVTRAGPGACLLEDV